MKRLLAIAMLVAACGGSTATPITHTITGTLRLSNGAPPDRLVGCDGTGGYSDIKVGAGVVVRDDKDAIVGTSSLVQDPGGPAPEGTGNYRCGYVFTVAGLPDVPFYSVEVSHRGAVTYSRADLESGGWAVAVSLGGS